MGSNLPVPNGHMEVLYRQTYDTLGAITTTGLTQNNRVGNAQKANNTRLGTKTNLGILAGSVVAVAGDGLIGAATGDSTLVSDKVVGVAVNDAVGNPFESSSAVGSGKVVYAHGSGTVFTTDIYETFRSDGTAVVTYTAGDAVYASRNGLLINQAGMDTTASGAMGYDTQVGIVLTAPSTANNNYLTVQMRI